MTHADWKPAAEEHILRIRAAMLAHARDFFDRRGVLEVETPIIVARGVTDPHIASIAAQAVDETFRLRTSPEYHMKRLLAAGLGDIYQIGKAFRDGERGRFHQPEFTMIEWYRRDFTMDAMIDESCALLRTLAAVAPQAISATVNRVSYRDVFLNVCNLDPFTATVRELKQSAADHLDTSELSELAAQLNDDRDGWLDCLMSRAVSPALADGTLWVVHDFPATQGLLAQSKPDQPGVAERFEIFLHGLELANGFHELTNLRDHEERFSSDRARRTWLGLEDMLPDQQLLAAIEHGLPDCSGVAVGLDRLLMLTAGVGTIAGTMSFAPGT